MSKTSADTRSSLLNAATTPPEGARLMQAIQAHATKWGLQPRKAKRPGEQSDSEEKWAQDSDAGQVGAEELDAAADEVLAAQAGMQALDGLPLAGEPVQLASLSGGQWVAQAGSTSAASGSVASGAAALAPAAGDVASAPASSPYLPLALVLGGVGLVAASGRSNAQALTTKGKLIDGYIAGATVFVDLNKNGQLDTGEASTVSDAQGNFTLPQGLNGPIVAIGGRDISTGLDFTGVLKAPAGSTTVTPLTTLVNELMTSSGLSATAAQDRVLDAVGLSALKGQVDLTKLDPVAGAAAGTAGALDLQKAGVMVATMVSSLTVKVQQTAGAGVDKHDEIASGIFAQVASTLTGATTGQLSASQIASTANTVVNTLAAQATPSVGGVSFNGATMKAASVSALENLSALASKVTSATTVDALASNQITALTNTTYTLQLLHFADAEAGLLASSTAPKLAALVDKFEDAYVHSITLAGGDNFIPGPFMAAGTDPSLLSVLGVPGNRGNIEIGALDIAIHNKIGVSASGLGNHEFDLGSNALAAAFRPGTGSPGADFVYLSANLDFAADSALNPHFVNTLATAGLEEASSLKGKIAPSAIITEGGAKIGLVGATTQLLESISSPSGTKVKDNDSVRSDDMDLLAQQLQPVIDDLIAQGVNKIILMSHLQVLANERLLATKLQGVDIILAAGSNTRLGDANDKSEAFAGHDANFADTYPLVIKDKDGKNTLVVNTDNEFTYLGRLVVDFDANGHILPSSLAANTAINGAYAATDANVATAWGTSVDQLSTTAYASGTRGAQVKALTDAVQTVINAKDGNVYGYADVYLEGERIAVRNQETNLGSLSADANAYALEQALGSAAAQTYIVSLKNGGGIRAQIGAISAPKADGTVDKLPPEGGVSQLDVENSLRFNNQLMAFDTTPAGLKAILEHGVASLGSQGRFPQLGGVSFSYDPDLAVGSRISDIALVGDGYRVNLYNDGALLSGAPAKFTVVTLNFLANGGDQYPMKANGENFRYVVEQTGGGFALTEPVDEAKNFTETATINAAVGTGTLLGEQRAFEVYMKAFHATPQTAYKQAETTEAQDTRIQNLNVRSEDVLLTQLGMSQVGTFATNAFDAGGAEIVAFDAGTKRMFLVNAVAAEIQVVSLADPANPVLVGKLDLKGYATTTGSTPQVNSVASAGGVVAVALADADPTKAGKLVLFKADLAVSTTAAAPTDARALDTGVGPDMVTFTPDGKRLLVANEAESINERASTDPFYNAGAPFVANGGITVVTLGTEAASAIANATVQQLDFSAFNGKEGLLRERGVRIASGTTAANDLEPEYIAVSPDGKQAMVTLQENNAVAVLNLSSATASIVDIVALGYKNHARGDLVMTAYDTLSSTELGTIDTDVFGKAVPAGGFSGLHYTGLVNGKMRFLAVSDRGPNGEPVNVDGDAALERPFVLPSYQARVSTLEFDPVSEQLSIVSTTLLTRADGTPLTGLPNIPGTDEEPVQIVPASDANKTGTFVSGTTTLGYKTLAYDTLGADLEGIYQTASGNMWMVDEYRPAVYEFDAAGKMVARFVPEGTAALTADTTDNFGTETLPAHLIKRQANRGFEALAVDEAKGLLFAFVQSPLDSVAGSTVDTTGPLVRIEVMAMRDLAAGTALPQGGTLAAAVSKGAVIAEYAYLLDRPTLRVNSQIDKIGDAAFNPATGTLFVFERDNEIVPEGKKMLFEIDLRGATNLLTATPTLPAGKTALEALTVDELLAAGINPVYKEILANLPTLGFLPNDKAEGLALLPNGGLAVINDNDFGVNGAGTETVGFGVLNFNGANRIDADNDTTGQPSGTIPGINIVKAGLYGAYMPDGIAAFSAKGKTYYITANEGDSRGVDEVQIKQLGQTGRPVADASAGAALIDGDLKVLANGIDVDGDSDIDKLVAFGGRSFSILDAYGNRVFDSGDQIERLIAEVLPANFNASHTSNSLDNRSDDKGPEPEGVTTAVIDGKVYAFVGLERIGGVVVYDISDPYQPSFVSYSNNRDFSKTPALAVGGDLGPEGLMVIPASASPTGKPLVLVANEVSGTVTLFNAQQTLPTETDPKLWLGEQLSRSELFNQGITKISAVQGASAVAAKLGELVTIEGIVTAWMPGLSGFFVQEEAADMDTNPLTSEAVFVYYGSTNPGVSEATVGDTVRVSATVGEYQKNTQLASITDFTVIADRSNTAALPAAVSVTLPVAESFSWESVEGMRVEVKSATTNGNLVVTDNYVLGRYGSVTLTSDELLVQYTQQSAPSIAGFTAYSAVTQRDQIVLDDGISAQNPAAVFGRGGQALSASNTLRAGDTTASVVGIVDQFDNGTAPAYETTYRVQSTATPVFAGTARPTAEQLQTALGTAELKVASVNVLNFFNTLGTANFNNPNGSALAGRGADNQAEYGRQLEKVVANLLGLDADVYGLMEIQNNGYADGVSALDALVDALNAKVGSAKFAYVAGPFDDGSTKAGDAATAGDDAIMVALVYDKTAVEPLGRAAVPDAVTYDAFGAAFGNRVPLAQTFKSLADGETFTVAVNHLKSKGSVIDADTGDGQSANNLARMEGVKDLSAWLATNPTGAPDSDLLLIGDLNAYAKESPISFLEGAGYNLVSGGLSYSFDGLWGSLDHAMANASMASQVTKSVLWTSNAEEPVVLDYNTNFKSLDQQTSFYAADAYRASDHNPVLIGLNLSADTTAPVLQSARVDGNTLTLSYAEYLKPDALPAANAFSLTVNGQAGPAVTQVAVLGQTATLTLATAVLVGETVTLAYTDPSSANDANALQDLVGNDAVSLPAQAVVNATVSDTTGPVLSSSTPAAMATGVAPTANVVMNFNEPLVKGSGTITIRHQINGLVLETLDVTSDRVTVSGSSVTIDPVKTLALGKGYAVEISAGAIEDAKGNDHAGLVGADALKFTVTAGTPVFVSEIHYDNVGNDSGEGVSIFGPAGTNLAGWSVVPYNGSNGQSYTPLGSLSGTIDNENNSGFGELTFAITGLQNGAPDAIALVNASNQVVQFLSYEGSFAATNGPAIGLTSTDIGVSQSGTEAAGLTLQIGGTGTLYEQLAWAAPSAGSQGTINTGHTLPAVPSSTLGVGDLVFLGANGDATDAFAFAILKDIAKDTKIGFTDRDYSEANGMPASGESAFIWTADTNYAAGTIVTIQPDAASGPLADKGTALGAKGGLSASGETVYAFLGDIAALANGSAGGVTVTQLLASLNVGGAAAGDVPASIGATSVSLSLDNARYSGGYDFNDLPAFLLAADNPANWQTSDTLAFALVNNSLFPV